MKNICALLEYASPARYLIADRHYFPESRMQLSNVENRSRPCLSPYCAGVPRIEDFSCPWVSTGLMPLQSSVLIGMQYF